MKKNKQFEEDFKNKLLSESALQNVKKYTGEASELILSKKTNKLEKFKISIIIPTHNRFNQLLRLLNSIFSQTYSNIEVILIDDVSTDDTNKFFESIEDERIKYVRNTKNLGMGLNRQKGYKIATGDFIIFSDDDDYYIDDDYFKDAINIFKDKSINLICSSSYIHYENEDIYEYHLLNFSKKIKSYDYLERFQFDLLKPTSTFPLIIRKSILEEADFKNMKMMNDSSIYLRSLMIGGNAYANKKIIGIYRVNGKNDTFNVKADFTIKNLKEKKYVYKYLKNKELSFDLKEWYIKEIKITACHFLNGREKSKAKRKKVLYWILFNVSYELFKELYKSEKDKNKI